METIAERDLILIQPDGERRPFNLRIGKPCFVSKYEWACPIQAEALGVLAETIQGIDSFQALILALNLVREVMLDLAGKGFAFHHPEDDSPVDPAQLFVNGA